ncbi:MAG: hypothetical protein KF687_04060 [Cyclobacteriaceae bacterium]|nr:hypothetical protein [Cyclobacteriaceae bacterium]
MIIRISLAVLFLGSGIISTKAQEIRSKPIFSKELDFVLHNRLVLRDDASKFFLAKGRLNLFDDHLIFHVYVGDELKPYSKIWKKQYLVKDFKIDYSEIKSMKRNYILLIVPTGHMTIEIKSGICYRFASANEKLRIIEFIKERM